MAMTEKVQPSFICQSQPNSRARTLLYSSSMKSYMYIVDVNCLGVISSDFQASEKRIVYWEGLHERNIFAVSPDGSLMAMSIREVRNAELHTYLSLCQLPSVINSSHTVADTRSFLILPDLGIYFVSSLKFFPDGKRIVVSLVQDPIFDERSGCWCRIYTIPDNLWSEDQTETGNKESLPDNREFKVFEYIDIDVIQQKYFLPEIFENRRDVEIWPDRSAKCGFYSLAISPDTNRILMGSHDGEIFLFETSTLRLLQRVATYKPVYDVIGSKFDVRIITCHYNPVLPHHEFVICGHTFVLKIWQVDELPDGTENARIVHELPLEPKRTTPRTDYIGGCCCNYSADGKLIATTCEIRRNITTFVIDSQSSSILYSLVYTEDPLTFLDPAGHSLCHNMFAGNLCQVAAVSYDDFFCVWKLPVIYSLETLCFLYIKDFVKYNDIDQLSLPSSLKVRLKYLYV